MQQDMRAFNKGRDYNSIVKIDTRKNMKLTFVKSIFRITPIHQIYDSHMATRLTSLFLNKVRLKIE